MKPPATVLFACIHNAGRSQIAAAWFERLADPAKVRAISAGTEPADHVHPVVVDAMRESGIELGAARPRQLTPELARGVTLLITMGCGEQCPSVPGVELADWPLPDPKDASIASVRTLRDDIRRRVETLLGERGWRGWSGASP